MFSRSSCRFVSLALPAFALLGCPTEEGTIQVTVFGGAHIENGIPDSVMADGWAVEFQNFQVTIEEVQVAGESLPNPGPVDLAEPSAGIGQELGTFLAAVGDHGAASFTLARIEVQGTASKDREEKTFRWVFDEAIRLHACDAKTTVRRNQVSTLQITIRAEHLFSDSLMATEPRMLFGSIAEADIDGNGEIARAELERTGIGRYDAGANDGIDDLWSYLGAQAKMVAYVDGDRRCVAE